MTRRATIVGVAVVALLAVIAIAILVQRKNSPTVSSAFIAYRGPTPSPTPIPAPTGSADPSLCAVGTYDAGRAFGYLLGKELREAENALTSRQYKIAVRLARDGETRVTMCGVQAGSDAPQVDVYQAKFQLIEAESYIGYGDDRASITLGEAEATASSAEHSIDADASTKRMAHQISEQIARDLANLEQ
jgi:hypothetical protein